MDKLIKLMPEYGCLPLWEYLDGDLVDNSSGESLTLTSELREALKRWATAYEVTLNPEYPPDSGFANPAEEEAFESEGRRLWQQLQMQLAPEYRVSYFSQHDGKLHEPETKVEDGPDRSDLHTSERIRSRTSCRDAIE
jgi:hypothetical protein